MNKNGFTLLEVVFVLGIWTIIILLSTPIQFSVLDKQQENQFFKTLEFDLLYMQNMSYSTKEFIRLTFKPAESKYIITQGNSNELLVERIFPAEWEIDKRTMSTPITFNENGTIMKSGVLFIETKHSEYNIVFPLGKGRYYIEEK